MVKLHFIFIILQGRNTTPKFGDHLNQEGIEDKLKL